MSEAPVPENEAGARVVQEEPCLPGATLRAAREAKGLLPEAVAQVTRFSVCQVEALERDDYARLPGITAVRGFVRSYAKFLKLDATPLLATLDLAAPLPAPDVREPAHIGEVDQPKFLPRAMFRYATIAAAGFLLLGGLWYIIRLGSDTAPGHLQSAPPMPAIAAEPAPVNPVVAVAPPASTASPPAPTEVVSGVDPTPATVVATPAAQGLRLEFAELSWVEIRDATQQIVFSGEYPAGTRQDVAGKPPFQLWIGKASGVRVFFGERNVDLQPYTRAEVARLTVE